MAVAFPLQELHHCNVVGEIGGGRNDLVEVGGKGPHALKGGIEFAGTAEVVERQHDSCIRVQLIENAGL